MQIILRFLLKTLQYSLKNFNIFHRIGVFLRGDYIKDKKRVLKEKIAAEKAKATPEKELKKMSAEERQFITGAVRCFSKMAQKYNIDINIPLNEFAEKMKISRATLDAIAKEEGAL